ncbi:MAG: acyl-CoA thioesterase [Zetaproteobacteria bacterium]|nr:acyl-CoA thioesterase [Pseudobdellovibrionaceae bacterium]
MTEMVQPQHTNALGSVFGGVVLSWVDTAAAICAQKHSEKKVVTASFDAMQFLAPIPLGWIVNIKASVNFVARSSCEVGVRITAENPLTGEFHHTASAYVTMVALDSHGKSIAMPKVEPETEEEKIRFENAQERRKARLDLKEKFLSKKKS